VSVDARGIDGGGDTRGQGRRASPSTTTAEAAEGWREFVDDTRRRTAGYRG
jgi:hypothetical protein